MKYKILTAAMLVFCAAAPAASAEVGDYVEVTVDSAQIRSGNSVVAEVKKGEKFEILNIHAPYFGVLVKTADGEQRGYLWEKHVRVVPPPRAPLYVPPAPEKYVRVTAAEATVRAGEKVIATLRKGEVLPIRRSQTGWISVEVPTDDGSTRGWIQDTLVERVDHFGSSMRGWSPVSVQQANVAWSNGEYIVSASIPASSGNSLAIGDPQATYGSAELKSGAISIQLADAAPLTPHTGSLWLHEEGSAAHRIDLPAPQLRAETASVRYDSFSEGQFLSVEIAAAAPGMKMHGCLIRPGRDQVRLLPLETDRDYGVAFSDFYQSNGKTYARLSIRDVPDQATRYLYLRLEAPWGALSDTIAIRRDGNRFANDGTSFKDQKSGFVDAAAAVPNIELMPVDLAEQVLTASGLKAEFVSAGDLKAIDKVQPGQVVRRQGIAPGEPLLIGETVLLSLGDAPALSGDEAAAADRATIDVADTLSLAALEPLAAPKAPVDESSLEWLTGAPSAIGVLSIGVDAGVSVDPQRSEQATLKAAYLKLLIAATLANPLKRMPGGLGEAFRRTIAQEDEIVRAMASPDSFDATGAARQVADALAITLSENDARKLLEDWRRYSRYRATVDDFDHGGDRYAADDIAIWIVAWLFENGLYDPLRSSAPTTDSQGNTLAVLFESGQAPAWSVDAPLPIAPVGHAVPSSPLVSAAIANLNQQAPTTIPSPAAPPGETSPPQGDPLVRRSDGPTQVRVPAIVRETVATADTRLGDIGLRLANVQRLLANDRITSANPSQRTWVRSGSSIDVEAERQVPNVLGFSPGGVDRELARYSFRANRIGKVLDGDVAVTQSPTSGEYASVDEPIDVSFRAVMPHLVGKLVEEGLQDLKQRDLRYQVDTKIFLPDKIVSQRPAAGALIEHGDAAHLVVHTKTPSVVGRSLAAAEETLGQFDLQPNTPNRLARSGDTVRGQSPDAGTWVPHESSVRLSPVVTQVPNVVGYSLTDAQTQLDTRNDIRVRTVGDLLGRDRITAQNPQPGTEIERGSSVVLDARVPTPNVRGQNLIAAADSIRRAGGELSADILGYSQGTDVVYAQSPNPGELLMPRSTVSLTPGVNIPSVDGLSIGEAQRRLANVSVDSQVTSSSTQETTNRGLVGQVRVTGQSHQGLTPRRNVDTVRLAVSEYILAIRTVPFVHEQPPLTAISMIERADLRVGQVVVSVNGGHRATRRMSVGEFRGFLLGQALASLIGVDQVRITSSYADSTQPGAGTQLVAGTAIDLYVNVFVEAANPEQISR